MLKYSISGKFDPVGNGYPKPLSRPSRKRGEYHVGKNEQDHDRQHTE